MPYIKQELRDELEYSLDVITGSLNCMFADKDINKAGVLNYVITVLIDNAYGPLSDAKYKDYNEAIGMLECCKLEFYRKAAAPYEDLKERENGKVLDGFFKDPEATRIKLGQRKQPIPNDTQILALDPRKDMIDTLKRLGLNNKVIDHKDKLISMIKLDTNTTIFIRSSSLLEANHILNKLLQNEKFSKFDYLQVINRLAIYQSWENLEPEIKNAFLAQYRDFSERTEENRYVVFVLDKSKSPSITKISEESVQSFTSNGKINITKRNLIFSVKVNLDTTIYIRANSINDADHIFDQIEPYKDGPRDYDVIFVSHFVDLDKDLKAEFLKKEISGTPEDSLYIIIKKVICE